MNCSILHEATVTLTLDDYQLIMCVCAKSKESRVHESSYRETQIPLILAVVDAEAKAKKASYLDHFLVWSFSPHHLLVLSLAFSRITDSWQQTQVVIDCVMQIYMSCWNSTITCTWIITSLRNAPASLHSQLLLCIWSYNHSPTMHLMSLLAADQNLLVNKPDGVWF